MRAGDAWDHAPGELSPEVERFLMPREMPPLRVAVLSATKAGVLGSAAAICLLLVGAGARAGVLLAAKTLALRLTGDAGLADGWAGLTLIALLCLAFGAALGALFGVAVAEIVGKVGPAMSVIVGVTYGLLIWIVGQFVILAYLAPDAFALCDQHVLLLCHVAYGAALGLLPLLPGEGWGEVQGRFSSNL
jgi:hypothetical protein